MARHPHFRNEHWYTRHTNVLPPSKDTASTNNAGTVFQAALRSGLQIPLLCADTMDFSPASAVVFAMLTPLPNPENP
jgi:hypothetical protein